MNTSANNRVILTKAVLWCVLGVASVVIALRFAHGLGAATALTDTTPWGFWIGFDVLAGVALAAGGFVVAATVYILGRERYHELARPAILTALLGYLAVIFGLLVDLGRPWNIWQVIFHWNPHSPLFEVAVCVILYTTVLALEFAPVGLESIRWAAPVVRLLRRLTLPLVILGIALSSLHQSSLGTLFLLQEGRMHPLWYSPLLPAMFLISAIGLGMGMVALESVISAWLYRREPEWGQLRGLCRAARWVLGLYLVIRLGDLVVRGEIGNAFASSWFAVLFWVEIALSVLLPLVLFSLPGARGGRAAIGWGALLTVAGFILHRADVGGISHIAVTGEHYVPALSELIASMGVVAGLGLVFLFFVENLKVWEEPPAPADPFARPAVDPHGRLVIRGPWFGAPQRAVLAWMCGAVVGLGVMEAQLASRREAEASPVAPARSILVLEKEDDDVLRVIPAAAGDWNEDARPVLLLDGSHTGRHVAFDHRAHQSRLGGETSCATCHHRNVPLDRGTPCTHCHRDMYRPTDTFDHERHVVAGGGRASCAGCHLAPGDPKTRAASKSCDACHPPVASARTRVRPASADAAGLAASYQEAMHGLCIACHEEHERTAGVPEPHLSRCATCHRPELDRLRPTPEVSPLTVASGPSRRMNP